MQQELRGLAAGSLLAATCIAVVPQAHAISLGDVEVRSALGEALDVQVPLGLAPGEVVDANCFALARDPEPGVPVLAQGVLTVDRAGDRTLLRIRSNNAVYEPAMRVRIRASCPGSAGETLRQYAVLLDPRRGDPVVAQVPVVSASLGARTGDTLEGLATHIFPRDAAVRDRYVEAMRVVNPALASLGSRDPIPEGASVMLPDLRTFSRQAAGSAVNARVAAPEVAARPAAPRRVKHRSRAAAPKAARERIAASDVQPATSARTPAGDFVLKLSSEKMDLAPTRQVDERTRAQLRERLLILDSDDQVSAVLALRNRLTQLESRVNELQLKLAQMPASFPTRTASEAAPAAAPQPQPVAPVPSATVDAGSADASAKSEAAPAAPAAPATAPSAPDTSANAKNASGEATTSAATATATAPAATKPAVRPAPSFSLTNLWPTYALWAAFVAVLALLMLFVWRLTHRREGAVDDEAWEQLPADEPDAERIEPRLVEDEEEAAGEPARSDAGALRRRYIEERFPEVLNRTLVLDDPSSVVKVARLFYEDGAMPRAVELLKFAIEEDPAELRAWLALFEIYRLERLTGEFAELARRFYEEHGDSEYWRKVRYFGREIDPGNFLYREDVDAIETIHPPGSRGQGAERFDPARENWLEAPMDFENEVLANELRQALMNAAGVAEQDLVPNPMPALRDAEMFTVA